MSDAAKTDMPHRVWVIGGGITGLTAAHELAERGFKVFVVEPEEDVRRPGEPALGGMAKTQWALLPPADGKGMQSTVKPTPFRPIHFDVNAATIDSYDEPSLADYAKAIGKYSAIAIAYYGNDDGHELAKAQAEAVIDALKKLSPNQPLDVKAATPKLDPNKAQTVEIQIRRDMVPGEHGFRFFHGFYRHVFDTMRRIPIIANTNGDHQLTHRTVYDNLSPSDGFGLDFPAGDGKPARSVEFPRRHIYGLRELFDTLSDFMRRAGHTAEDIGRISLSIFKYMTSCRRRRETEYEDMSWWDFVDGQSFDDPARKHYRDAPRVLVGLTAEQCDARTQGNVIIQMLMDVLFKGERADATLNANTTAAWFEPWRKYLEIQEVEFLRTTMTGFTKVDDHRFIPTFKDKDLRFKPSADDYFILATSLPALLGDESDGDKGLLNDFFEKRGDLNPKEARDFVQLRMFGDAIRDGNEPALRHMNGIQFFFATEVPKKAGRSLYLESQWQLSSLSQTNFWERPRLLVDGYRGVLSVDIGDWNARDSGNPPRSAWESNRETIAERVWQQIKVTIPSRQRNFMLEPRWFHIDDCIEFDEDANKGVKRNSAPYLVSRPGDWKKRPGELMQHKADESGYQMQCGHWVLAGTYMKTYTRLTSMESANESARHAVNGILHAMKEEKGGYYPSCKIWDPEDHELPDLKWLLELDERLYAYPNQITNDRKVEHIDMEQRLPHFIDILAADDVGDWLGLVDSGISIDDALRKLITRIAQWKHLR